MSQSTVELLLLLNSRKKPAFLKIYMNFLSILMSFSSWKCDSPLVYQISSKSNHQRRSYDVMAIFQLAAVSYVRYALG